jgi:hypothetical protein
MKPLQVTNRLSVQSHKIVDHCFISEVSLIPVRPMQRA